MDNQQQNFISNIGGVMTFISQNYAEFQWLIQQAQGLGYLVDGNPNEITQEDIDSIPSFASNGVTVQDLARGVDVITQMRNFATAFPDTLSKLANLP